MTMNMNMNKKLKIYAKETKEGKEIHQTQFISISSPDLKQIDNNDNDTYEHNSYTLCQSRLRASKLNKQNKVDLIYSYVKNKALPKRSKELNKSLNLTSQGDKMTIKSKGSLNQTITKSKTPLRTRALSKEKVEASINFIINLKDKISQLNSQIDLYEEEHSTIVSLGDGAINELKKDNQELKKVSDSNKDRDALLYEKEREKIKKKRGSIALLRKAIEENDNKHSTLSEQFILSKNTLENIQQNVICATRHYYEESIKDLDNQILLLSSQIGSQLNHNKEENNDIIMHKEIKDSEKDDDDNDNMQKDNDDHEMIINNEKKCNEKDDDEKNDNEMVINKDQLSKKEVTDISFIIKILCSLYSMNIESILDNTFDEESKITTESISDNLLSLIDSLNQENKKILLKYFNTLINETSSQFNYNDQGEKEIDTVSLKKYLSSAIGAIHTLYANNDELDKRLNKLLLSDKEKLLDCLKEKDSSNSGFISFREFNAIIADFNYPKINDRVYEYMIFLMKKDSDSEWIITDLNYMALVNIIKGPEDMIRDIDMKRFIKLMKNYLIKDNNNTIEDFLSPFEYLVIKMSDEEFIDTKLFNTYLRTKKVIHMDEVLVPDKDNYHNLTVIKRLMSEE